MGAELWTKEKSGVLMKPPLLLRQIMRPKHGGSCKTLRPLPEGYRLMPFDAAAFSLHPFGHGRNYADFDDFSKRGFGAAVMHKDEIVSAASSFITFGNDIEMDVSTAMPHRGKGLADHCVSAVMEDCAARGCTVHWDAQNLPSARMAESHGFRLEQEYAVYILKH